MKITLDLTHAEMQDLRYGGYPQAGVILGNAMQLLNQAMTDVIDLDCCHIERSNEND